LEKAVHILNTSAPNKIDFRGTAAEIARQVFTPRSGRVFYEDEVAGPARAYERLESAREDFAQYAFEVAPWHKPPEFLSQIRDATRYGGTEFLDLIVQAAEAITTRNEPDLPDPIDPSSI
jgi:hypothetical protein